MNPKKIWANLGVKDLQRTTEFYTRLGFKPNGRSEELTSFCFGTNEFIIHFFLKHVLELNIGGRLADTARVNEMVFTLAAESRQQADDWSKEIEQAGGQLLSKPVEFGDGYYGFLFADPDGHRFNIFHMKGL